MIRDFAGWLGRNLGLLLLALVLSGIVWVSAVTSADPNQECSSPSALTLNVEGKPDRYLLQGEVPSQVGIRLFAPRSVCEQMAADPDSVGAEIDLTGLEAGPHRVEVEYSISPQYFPVRILETSPIAINLTLEEFASRTLPLVPEITGQPAPGYSLGLPILNESRVVISGTRSLVDRVASAVITLDVTDATGEINTSRPVQLLDESGALVTGLEITPATVNIRQIIERPGTFREVIVRVIYEGAPAEGYRLTSITPTPQIVTIFSSDSSLIREMPGFVETEPIDLTGSTDDIEQRVRLVLPDGVFVDGEQNVLVLVGIAAIESSITLNLPVELIGLPAELEAMISPETVDVIVSGPLPILDGLQPLDIRVVLDMAGLEPGTYNLEPRIEIIPVGLFAQTLLPSTIEVIISVAPTPTATVPVTPVDPLTLTLTPGPTPTEGP
jgi:YbbR domain-containing protein